MKNFYLCLIGLIIIICLEIAKYFLNYILFYSFLAIQITLIIMIIVLFLLKIKLKKSIITSLSLVLI